MIVVSDTSPLINLAIIDQLTLLQKLYDTVIIPQAVYDEIVTEGIGQAGAIEIAQANWIEVKQIANHPLVVSLEKDLDIGEAEAIVLTIELEAGLLLIDERKGRMVADRFGVKYIGLLGILINAKQAGLISTVGGVMDDLRNKARFWISEELYRYVLQMAGEG